MRPLLLQPPQRRRSICRTLRPRKMVHDPLALRAERSHAGGGSRLGRLHLLMDAPQTHSGWLQMLAEADDATPQAGSGAPVERSRRR